MKLANLEAIEASAGTGKTFQLAQRVLEEVAGGRPVGRMVVVTFTISAAAELKTRIRNRLRDALRLLRAREAGRAIEAQDEVLREWIERCPAEAAARLHKALIDFDEATISTIHSFCSQLLGQCAFEAGASLSNLDGNMGTEVAVQVADDIRRWLTTNQDELFVTALDYIGLDTGTLTTLAHRATELESVALPRQAAEPGPPPDFTAYRKTLDEVRAHANRQSLRMAFRYNPALASRTSQRNRYSFPPVQTDKDISELLGWLDQPNLVASFPSFAERFTRHCVAQATLPGQTPPDHGILDPMDRLMVQHHSFSAALGQWATRLRRQIVSKVREKTAAEARRRDDRSFDDLLRIVRDSLGEEALAGAVDARWDMALVDEFQDTDPVQWAVFRDLFAHKKLVVVGDPKQSIYAFRRADINSYVQAVLRAGEKSTLETNYRSDERLLEAMEQIFDGPLPFAKPKVGFAAPSAHHTTNRLGDHRPPMVITHIERRSGSKLLRQTNTFNNRKLEPICVERVAEDVAIELTQHGASPSECAVLTRTNKQVLMVRDALRRRGIPSVLRTTDTAFDSPVAGELLAVIDALIEPTDRGRVSRALITNLMGKTAQDLVDLREDAIAWSKVMHQMRVWSMAWQDGGVLAALEQWASQSRVWPHVLSRPLGGREAADLRHLFELLHQAEFEERMSPTALRDWMASGGRSADEEEASQRVESDADAVFISTIHKAKGLEYGRVWLPFLWASTFLGTNDKKVARYYDDDEGAWMLDARLPLSREAEASMFRDKLQEDLRLAYVGLTRAKHRCVFYWGAAGRISALGYLLHRDRRLNNQERLIESAQQRVGRSDRMMVEDLRGLARHPNIELVSWNPEGPIDTTMWRDPNPVDVDTLAVRERTRARHLDTWWRRTSFSGMTKNGKGEAPEQDRDESLEEEEEHQWPEHPVPMSEVPGGTHMGDTVHDALEHFDFGGEQAQLTELVSTFAKRHGVEQEHVETISRGLFDALHTPIFDDGFTLAQLPWSQTLREPGFVLPVRGAYSPAKPLSKAALAPCFSEPLRSRIKGMGFLPLTGFLSGRIDLVFEREGRFHVLDWKSNKLGPNWDDYSPKALETAMDQATYTLQAQLYALAVHKMLRQRIGPESYDYERHFGTIIYTFLRGMSPETGLSSGVWRHRPSLETLTKLEETICG